MIVFPGLHADAIAVYVRGNPGKTAADVGQAVMPHLARRGRERALRRAATAGYVELRQEATVTVAARTGPPGASAAPVERVRLVYHCYPGPGPLVARGGDSDVVDPSGAGAPVTDGGLAAGGAPVTGLPLVTVATVKVLRYVRDHPGCSKQQAVARGRDMRPRGKQYQGVNHLVGLGLVAPIHDGRYSPLHVTAKGMSVLRAVDRNPGILSRPDHVVAGSRPRGAIRAVGNWLSAQTTVRRRDEIVSHFRDHPLDSTAVAAAHLAMECGDGTITTWTGRIRAAARDGAIPSGVEHRSAVRVAEDTAITDVIAHLFASHPRTTDAQMLRALSDHTDFVDGEARSSLRGDWVALLPGGSQLSYVRSERLIRHLKGRY